jgi:ferric-dicitrate binding protein FerR (iron transport regulator)
MNYSYPVTRYVELCKQHAGAASAQEEERLLKEMERLWSTLTPAERREADSMTRADYETKRARADTLTGAALVGALLALLLLLTLCGAVPKLAFGREAPGLVVLNQPSIAYLPSGERIALPAGTEFDACADTRNLTFEQTPVGNTLQVLQSCDERSLFTDGFED